MHEKTPAARTSTAGSQLNPFFAIYEQAMAAARAQMQRNAKTLGEADAKLRSNTQNVMNAASSAAESYLQMAACTIELYWHTLSIGQEIARTTMTRSAVGELKPEKAAQSFFDSIHAQMIRFNAAMTNTGSDIMESTLIVPSTGTQSKAAGVASAAQEQ